MHLLIIDLSSEFQSFVIVKAFATIGIGCALDLCNYTMYVVMGSRVSRFSDNVFGGKICPLVYVLHVNFKSLFWPIKCMHSKPQILGTLWPLFCFLIAFSKALICHKAEEYVLK